MEYNVTYRERNKGIQAIVSYKDQHGKWKQKSKQGFEKKKDAKKWADAAIQELKDNIRYIDHELSGITFGEFAAEYVDHAKVHMQPNTIRALEMAIKKFNPIHNIELANVSRLDLQKVIDILHTQGLKSTTVRQYMRYISMVFTSAYADYEIIQKDPSKGLKIVKDKVEIEQIALTDEEVEQLLNDFKKSRYYPLLYLLSKTGLRVGEALGLTIKDINFATYEIDVNKQWKEISRGTHGFGTLKSKKSYRQVPIPSYVARELKKMIKVVDISTGRIFDFQTDYIQASINKAIKKKGYENITLHTLRHSYITKLLANNMDVKSVATIAGHSVEMTMKIYSHMNKDMFAKAKNKIENII